MPQTIHGELRVSLFHVERSSYHSLHLVDLTHPYWALSFVAAGDVRTECRGCSFSVQPGDIMIHPPGMVYAELADGPGTHEWLLLEATHAPNIDLLRQHPVAPVVHLSSPDEFSHLFNRLLTTWQERTSTLDWLHVLALTTELLSLVLHSWETAGSPQRPAVMNSAEDRFTHVINYMADHLDEKLSREMLASIIGLHPVYFDRLFRQTYSVPPMHMVREMRLRRAKDVLESSDATVTAIAYTCGFGSGPSFVRAFQQRFGQTPGDYRQGLKMAKNRYVPFL